MEGSFEILLTVRHVIWQCESVTDETIQIDQTVRPFKLLTVRECYGWNIWKISNSTSSDAFDSGKVLWMDRLDRQRIATHPQGQQQLVAPLSLFVFTLKICHSASFRGTVKSPIDFDNLKG